MSLTRSMSAADQSFGQWVAQQLRIIADRYDPPVQRPEISAVAARQLYDAQLALLDAQAEKERASNTVVMLEQRVERLTTLAKSPQGRAS